MDEKETIIELYNTGYSARMIADEFDVSKSTILRRLRNWEVAVRSPGHQKIRELDNHKEEIIKLYEDGGSSFDIASIFNVSNTTILHRLSDWGIDTRTSGSKSIKSLDRDQEQIMEMYENGKTLEEIANKYNCSLKPISRRLKLWGVDVRSSGPQKIYGVGKEEIIEMYREGTSTREIAHLCHCSVKTIKNRLERWNDEIDAEQVKSENSTEDNTEHMKRRTDSILDHKILVREWHPEFNWQMYPDADISRDDPRDVWWLCSRNSEHVWSSKISDRLDGKNCPQCEVHQ